MFCDSKASTKRRHFDLFALPLRHKELHFLWYALFGGGGIVTSIILRMNAECRPLESPPKPYISPFHLHRHYQDSLR